MAETNSSRCGKSRRKTMAVEAALEAAVPEAVVTPAEAAVLEAEPAVTIKMFSRRKAAVPVGPANRFPELVNRFPPGLANRFKGDKVKIKMLRGYKRYPFNIF
jgi:hypothetical protein